MTRNGPLSNVRVLDFSRLLPGPWATLALADLGADVVKVEDPNGGDYLRAMPPAHGEDSAMFLSLNRGKRSVAFDLKNPEDLGACLQLAAKADVVVESFRPGVMARLGLGWEVLHELNPRLVLCSITGFGQTGPHASRAGHDIGFLALSGVLAQIGTSDTSPAVSNAQFADVAGGGLVAVGGILTALYERERTGVGRWVDVSMTEGVMSMLHMMLAPHVSGVGAAPERGHGPLSGECPSYSTYRTKDGRDLAVGAVEPKFWFGFCQLIGRPDLGDQGLAQGVEATQVKREIQAVVGESTLAEWTSRLAALDVCAEPVLNADELQTHPAHVARGVFFDGPHGPTQRTPIRFADRDEPPATAPAPALGADNAKVLEEWLSS